ncbi:MAG: hypothetical protein IPK85_16375 [Gemmatimonadetes bacterium]|nr:hypothetical protein [Gemmatimonadota bacterium]
MDGVVEFFLKYRPAAFARGTLGFSPPVPMWLVWLAVAAALAFAVAHYSRSTELARRDRLALGGLRLLAVGALAFALARPVLVIAESVAQRNIVAVLVDDSRSMGITDLPGGRSRSAAVTSLVGTVDSALLKALQPRYQTRVYRVSTAGKVGDANSIPFTGPRTRLLTALLRVQDELAGAPLAGIVVLSDGADNSASGGGPGSTGITEQMLSLRSRGVPVYSVGVGTPRFDKDAEVTRIDAPRSVLKNSTVLVNVVISHRGLGGTRIPVVVEDSGRIIGSVTVELPRNGEAVQARIRIPATEQGARLLRVHVPVQAGELVRENNERHTLLVVRDRREKILYMEGEPRFELKFAQRAVEGDENVQLVTLLRSAKDKFLRIGVDDSTELVGGFPRTREELFSYRGIVLGSIEASFFSADQLRMLSDFVSERGGGLMFLGGRSAYAEGGYAGTPLSDAFPYELTAAAPDTLVREVHAVLTPAGALHPALQVGGTDSSTAARWASLPPLTSVNAVVRAKPGATVLLNGTVGEGPATRPMVAVQRFGRGRVLGLGVQDTWLWQMHATIPLADSTHEVLWRQMLRWLVADVPDRVEVSAPEESGPGEAVPLQATVADKSYMRVNGATVAGEATAGSATSVLRLDWVPDRDGEYTGSFVPAGPGVHAVQLEAMARGDTAESRTGYVRVAEPTDEFFGAELRTALLRQVAEETGGGYYPPEDAVRIAEDIVYSPAGSTVVKKNDLWDMPLVLLTLLLALGGEWVLRRRRGLA